MLERAIRSVQKQDITAQVEHLIIIDDCHDTLQSLEAGFAQSNVLSWLFVPRKKETEYSATTVGHLRNVALQMSKGDWVAFLDDDNEWESNHLATLFAQATALNLDAIHSRMQLFYRDGSPFMERRVPWVVGQSNSKSAFEEFLELGIVCENSNIITNIFTDALKTVDMGEWLFKTSKIREIGFEEEFSIAEQSMMITEDDKLNQAMGISNFKIGSTRLPTLKYYLGGYSNKNNL